MAREAKAALREIALKYFKVKYPDFTADHIGSKELWSFEGKTYRPYFFADPNSKAFINSFSEKTIQSMVDNNLYYMGVHYYPDLKNQLKVYFLDTKLIKKLYIDEEAGRTEKGTWHLKVFEKDKKLVFRRSGLDEIEIPTDTDNSCTTLTMSDEEYEIIQELVSPKNQFTKSKIPKTLKVQVSGKTGSKEFSKLSARVIAILSILSKSKKPLTIDDIITGFDKYDIKIESKSKVTTTLNNLVETGGVMVEDQLYSTTENLKVEVILDV
jgi:hypothetical protein